MLPKILMFRIFSVAVIAAIMLCRPALESCGQSVKKIPSPLPEAWVIDQTETLSDFQKTLINELCQEIQTKYNRQLVVAVIASTNGRDHRRFAVDLFNLWRVGGGYKNQGVLVFAAMNDRAAEIILGHGIDNKNTRRAAQSIMDTVMIPKFKAGHAGSAIYEGVHDCAKRIVGVGKLAVADKLPEITAEQPVITAEEPIEAGAQSIQQARPADSDQAAQVSDAAISTESSKGSDGSETVDVQAGSQAPPVLVAEADGFRPVAVRSAPAAARSTPVKRGRPPARRKQSYLPWLLGFGGVGLLATFFGTRHYLRYRRRSCDTCRLDRVLLTEVQDDDFLSNPEQIEEKIGSVDYDVWACLECEEVVKLRYGRLFTRYSRCPDCSYVTRFKITETVIVATTMNGGLVRVKEFCKHCDYHHTYSYATPRIQKTQSRSSGGGFSSGSSSGGGFSSGGGASGRW